MKRDVWTCKATGCSRQVEKIGDLVCAGHWRLTPRDLRCLLNKEQRARESKAKQGRVVAAAGLIIAYLETVKIQLP